MFCFVDYVMHWRHTSIITHRLNCVKFQYFRYDAIKAAFRSKFEGNPTFYARASGRVNLIGEFKILQCTTLQSLESGDVSVQCWADGIHEWPDQEEHTVTCTILFMYNKTRKSFQQERCSSFTEQ